MNIFQIWHSGNHCGGWFIGISSACVMSKCNAHSTSLHKVLERFKSSTVHGFKFGSALATVCMVTACGSNVEGVASTEVLKPTPPVISTPPSNQVELALQDQSDVLSFTTAGKPTKRIYTPKGAREIYNPLADESVRRAFKNVYDKKYQNTKYRNRDYRRELGDSNLDIIFLAKEIHHTDILRIGCRSLGTFVADHSYGFWQTMETFEHPCDHEGNLGKPVSICEKRDFINLYRNRPSHAFLKGKIRPNPAAYPIGYNIDYTNEYNKENIEPIVKNLTWQDELSDFFDYECGSWR